MRTFLVALIRQFDSTLPEEVQEVRKMRPGIVVPVIVEEEHKGRQLLAKVIVLRND